MGQIMEVQDLIIDKLDNIEERLQKIEAFNNRLIGYGLCLSAIITIIFNSIVDFFKLKG